VVILLGIIIPGTAFLWSSSLGSSFLGRASLALAYPGQHPGGDHPWCLQRRMGSQDQGFPELKGRSFPHGSAPASPICKAPVPGAGGTASGQAALAAPGLPQDQVLPWLTDGQGLAASPVTAWDGDRDGEPMGPPNHVASLRLSARRSQDLAISVWGWGEKKKPRLSLPAIGDTRTGN